MLSAYKTPLQIPVIYIKKLILGNAAAIMYYIFVYFIVPKSWGRRRLIDFGYKEFGGFAQYAGKKPIPNHISGLDKNESYTINESDGIKEYMSNPEFRRILDTGQFIYVEGHYCLNTSEYICYDYFGNPHLTEKAKTHMSECCLVFKNTYINKIIRSSGGGLHGHYT